MASAKREDRYSPERVLQNEFKALSKERWVNIQLQNESLLRWQVDLMILNPDSIYYGGYFRSSMIFPADYPYSPPKFSFTPTLFHPNIYPDGRLCISILHPPGDDEMSGELASERWSPAQRVETVLLSIISLLDDAEISSPANVDAAKMLRDQPDEYKKRVLEDVEKSKANIPAGFEIPTDEVLKKEAEAEKARRKVEDDANFWAESDEEFDFGSDTDDADGDDDTMGEDAGIGEEDEDEKDSEDDDKMVTK